MVVHANNVTLKNCKITADGWWGIDNQGYSGMQVLNCEILNAQDSAILTGSGVTIQACNIHQSDHGVTVAGSNVVIQDNYIHDLPGAPGDADAHFDCIFLDGGYAHVKVLHNSLYGIDTACIFICNDFGAQDDILVDSNLCIADAVPSRPAIGIYVYEKTGNPAQITNVTVSNNVMTKGKAYFSIQQTEPVLINNVDYSTGYVIQEDGTLLATLILNGGVGNDLHGGAATTRSTAAGNDTLNARLATTSSTAGPGLTSCPAVPATTC